MIAPDTQQPEEPEPDYQPFTPQLVDALQVSICKFGQTHHLDPMHMVLVLRVLASQIEEAAQRPASEQVGLLAKILQAALKAVRGSSD